MMHSPDVRDLPAPSAGRTGFPWTEGTPPLPPTMPDGRAWPTIAIATPSYNQAAFLEETIRSVLLQGYPSFAYAVIDDGSTDDSVRVIERYSPWLSHWETGPNRGQASAINRGWRKVDGDLIVFINSDDCFLPNTFRRVAERWGWREDVAMITGGIVSTDEHSRVTARAEPRLPWPSPLDLSIVDQDAVLLPQPSSFYVRTHLDPVGRFLREDLRYTLDREIIYRLCRRGRVELIREPIATYRLHASSNTVGSSLRMHAEAPRALAYCDWGTEADVRARQRVGRWRVARGHFLAADSSTRRAEVVRHLALAVRNRPSYLLNKGTARMLGRTVGLHHPVRLLRGLFGRNGGNAEANVRA